MRPTTPNTTSPGHAHGGFALHEAFQRRVAGVSNLHVVQFPPASHVQVVETSCNTQPGPRIAETHINTINNQAN